MIPLTTAPSPVSMSAGVKSSNYTIELTGKTFDVLSSMLYKDPHLAIVRELSCNAYDSHVDNGCLDTPFDIHLPNAIEPYFSIRDYGTGMSAETIDTVYTSFFKSTKTHSNDVVGALGLGSKSPFSYTSNYTITSWHSGLKLVYSAFKTSDGIPSIALLDVSDTTEPSGLEVNFAVKAADFEKFTSKVQSYFTTWGSKPPTISGGLQGRTTLRHVSRDFGGTDWFVATSDGPLSSALAIQGNVPYPLQRNTITGSNAFREKFPNETDRSLIQRLLELPIIITFPIGSLDFSASREELQYTEQTVAVILDKLITIGSGIKQHIQDQFALLPTMWDVVRFCRSLRNDRLRNIVQLIGAGKMQWKGQTISIDQQAVLMDDPAVEAALAIHNLQVQTNKRRKMESFSLQSTKLVNDVPTLFTNRGMSFSPSANDINIVVLDEIKGSASKLKYHFLDKISGSSYGDVITIGVPRGTKLIDLPKFRAAVTQLLVGFRVVGSYVKVTYISNLTPPPARARAGSTGGKPDDTFKVFTPSIRGEKCPDKFATSAWSVASEADVQKHITDGKFKHIVFVPQIRGVPQYTRLNKDGESTLLELSEDFADLWNDMTAALGIKQVLLVGIKASALGMAKVKAFTQQAQGFDTFLRFWLYANAKTLAQSDAYHIEWVNNHGKQNIVLRAVAGITDSKHPTIATASTLVNKFMCDTTAQQRAASNRDVINRIIRILREIDRTSPAPDPMVGEIAIAVSNAGVVAKTEYAALTTLNKTVEVEFPMVTYVNSHFRYSGNERDILNACAQIQKYIKLASA